VVGEIVEAVVGSAGPESKTAEVDEETDDVFETTEAD